MNHYWNRGKRKQRRLCCLKLTGILSNLAAEAGVVCSGVVLGWDSLFSCAGILGSLRGHESTVSGCLSIATTKSRLFALHCGAWTRCICHIASEHRCGLSTSSELAYPLLHLSLHYLWKQNTISFREHKALSFAGAEQHASSTSQLAKQKR